MKPTTYRLLRRGLVRLWLPVVLLAIWWTWSAGSQDVYFPPLQQILDTLRRDWIWRGIQVDLLPTTVRLTLGFLIASILGLFVGTCLGLNPLLQRATEPIIQFLRSIPAPALLPLGLLFFGITSTMNVAVIVIGAIWPTLLSTTAGVRSIDPQLIAFAKIYRLTFRQRLFSLLLPNAGPQIFAGLRTTLQISIVLIVVSEMVGAVQGVGFYVLNAQQTFAIPETWAGTIVLGLMGFIASLLFVFVEKKFLFWQVGMQQAGAQSDG